MSALKRKIQKFYKGERGAITVITALLLTVLLGFTALTIDIGLRHYTGAKLQNAVDSAATAVAANIGSTEYSLEDIAYMYLAKNGFDREGNYKDVYEQGNFKVTIESKGVLNQATMKSEDDYITTGYYKITADVTDHSLFSSVLGIDSLDVRKTAYVKADANYVEMPKALKYSIFGASTFSSSVLEHRSTNWAAVQMRRHSACL